MLRASRQYKDMMNSSIRERGYVSISLGVVNQSAQGDATKDFGETEYYSNGDIFDIHRTNIVSYATFEDNYIKADGKTVFAPRNTSNAQFKDNGITTSGFNSPIRIDFGKSYDIKGITMVFAENAYPVNFTITSAKGVFTYTGNNSSKFVSEDVYGETSYLIITPQKFSGTRQRWHIQSIMFGVGFVFTNATTENVEIESHISSISDEVSYSNYRISVFDNEKKFDVDNTESFMQYFEPMQPIGISFGVDLGDGTQEWLQTATGYLQEWNSKGGVLSFVATDKLSQLNDEYSLGNVLQERTAYSEFEKILTDCGFESDEYFIDDFLHSFTFKNPIEPMPHREALQLLANATRCIVFEDENGILNIKANFETIIDPESFAIASSNDDSYSQSENVMNSVELSHYVDYSTNNYKLDGKGYLIPTQGNYLNTGYVSRPSNAQGTFVNETSLTISLPAIYSYYGISLTFNGVVPSELKVTTYNGSTVLDTFTYTELSEVSKLNDNYINFNKIKFEFTKTTPYARVQVDKIAFGDDTDYRLTNDNILDEPLGTMEDIVKTVRVKIYTFELDDDGNPKEVEDEVCYEHHLNTKGIVKTCSNPLISTESQAKSLAEWLGNYYKNNVSYSIEYRGEPRIQPSDIIRMDNDYKNNMQIEVQTSTLTFNGAFGGQLECRRALDMLNN